MMPDIKDDCSNADPWLRSYTQDEEVPSSLSVGLFIDGALLPAPVMSVKDSNLAGSVKEVQK